MSSQFSQDIIKPEAILQSLGYVDFVKNSSKDQQELLKTNPIQNFVPWRAVWNGNSMSIPCHLICDTSHASQTPSSSANWKDLLAKDKKNMNKLMV